MSFAEPSWLWGLLLVPALIGLEWGGVARDRERTARLVSRALWPRVVRRPREGWRLARLTLLGVAAASLVVALARPQWGIVRERLEREGVDVVLVLDTSGSMATTDVSPSRFFLARAALSSLISRLPDDRFALVAFEGEAYPLVPLTLDADAVGLFLEMLEPGFVPAPGSSLGAGLERGLSLFVDPERRNKVLLLVSDGEDLEGEAQAAVARAKELGVIVHTVGVGTEQGAPVPDSDDAGRQTGFKKDREGNVVVSRLNAGGLEAIARGTGGNFHRITPVNTTLAPLLAAIEGMEAKTLAREFSYRKQERFQLPLAVALLCLALALALPPPPLRRGLRLPFETAAALTLLLLGAGTLHAQDVEAAASDAPEAAQAGTRVLDEVLLRPRRLTAEGIQDYRSGNHPAALEEFEAAARARPGDPRALFNLATSLYKNGRYEESATLLRSLAEARGLTGPARYNLGNSLFQQQDFEAAIDAYREALRAMPGDEDTRRNLELALRALQQQQQQEQEQQQDPNDQDRQQQDEEQEPDAGDQTRQDQQQQQQDQQQPPRMPQPKPKSPEQRERERFEQEAGMPRERAMQLLDALQENEKDEQRKALAAQRQTADAEEDW